MASYSSDHTRRYLITNEVLNAATHGIATILSIIGLFLLIDKASANQNMVELVSYIIYGSSLILLYLSSTIYHSFKFTKARFVLRRLDHCSIFVLIAGSYTPFALVSIGGGLGVGITVLVWSIALFGVLYKIFWFNKYTGLSVWIYIAMGWLVIFFPISLYNGIGIEGILWLVAGGLAFTFGTIFYRLSHVKYMHVVWHLFVMLGTLLMFVSIYNYV